MYSYRSVSLNNEICWEIIEDKIAVCEKTAGLRSGNFSDLNSACSKVLVLFEVTTHGLVSLLSKKIVLKTS